MDLEGAQDPPWSRWGSLGKGLSVIPVTALSQTEFPGSFRILLGAVIPSLLEVATSFHCVILQELQLPPKSVISTDPSELELGKRVV